MDKVPDWMVNLDEEDLSFIKKFLLASGSLKEMAGLYGVTYPTVRLRLDRLIQKINMTNRETEDSYITLIKRLTLDDKVEFNVAKELITEYRKVVKDK